MERPSFFAAPAPFAASTPIADVLREADHHICSLHRLVGVLRAAGPGSSRGRAPSSLDQQVAEGLKFITGELLAVYNAAKAATRAPHAAAATPNAWQNPTDSVRIVRGESPTTPAPVTTVPVLASRSGAPAAAAAMGRAKNRRRGQHLRPAAASASSAPAASASTAPAPTLVPQAHSSPITPVHVDARNLVPIEVIDGLCLDAIVVPPEISRSCDVAAYVTTSELYFVPSWGHFAARIGAAVFHGNLGRVYLARPRAAAAARGSATRIIECRHASTGACDASKCDYYHDPAAGGGGADLAKISPPGRNFLAESWLYAPAGSRSAARTAVRRIGCRDRLSADLAALTPASARLFFDQVMHDLLCALLVKKYAAGL